MTLTLACVESDRTRRLLDGTLGIDGYRLAPHALAPEVLFARAFGAAEFDISELSFNTYLLHVGRGTCAFAGIPAFPARAFRHSAIYVRADGAISSPEDLRGRLVGVRNFLNTAALTVRGLLSDVHGVAASDIRWIVGDVDDVERESIELPRLTRPIEVEAAPSGTTLSALLAAGKIDALVHYAPPRGFGPSPAPIRRLFADPEAAARGYFNATGVFPIMHLVGIRKTLLRDDPSLAAKVYGAFAAAKDARPRPLPGAESTARWDYGISPNRAALEMLSRHAFEQGITERRLRLDELFVEELLQT